MHVAARKGDLKQLRKALKDGANVNEEDNAGRKIIDPDICDDLLYTDCHILGWTPLHEGNSFPTIVLIALYSSSSRNEKSVQSRESSAEIRGECQCTGA